MDSKQKTLFILLLLVTFFKGIIWAEIVPLWHFPDEQAHFAQVQWYAEQKKPISGEYDLSLEIYESERLLGTLRDERGINKYTYHPECNIDYTNKSLGKYEQYLSSLPKSSRTTYVKREAARYPPLFYLLSSLGYFMGTSGDLFVRVILTRWVSVFLAV